MNEVNEAKKESKPPILSVRGNLVGLGQWLPEHFERWLEAVHDPELNMHNDGGFLMPIRENEAANFAMSAKEGGSNFAIYALDTMKFIGSSGLFHVNQHHQHAELGISIIDKNYWGKGYGSETVRLVTDYAFRFMNLHSVWLETVSFNQRAARAYEKAGFKRIGVRREAVALAGQRYDWILMDCLRTEFESPRPGWFELPA